MKSPFPGMDPYLEGDLWTTFHVQLAVEIARQLTPRLLPRYFAFANQRQVTDTWVEIRDQAARRLVTLIEILSPTNKRGDGRKQYLRKRNKILCSSSHLMEIDLLRRGKRVPMIEALPRGDYFVFLTRASRRPETEIWPIALESPLPTVRVPLSEPDPDVPLDLQRAFETIYELSPYGAAIDYSKPPDVPLAKAAAAWAADRVNEHNAHPGQSGK